MILTKGVILSHQERTTSIGARIFFFLANMYIAKAACFYHLVAIGKTAWCLGFLLWGNSRLKWKRPLSQLIEGIRTSLKIILAFFFLDLHGFILRRNKLKFVELTSVAKRIRARNSFTHQPYASILLLNQP